MQKYKMQFIKWILFRHYTGISKINFIYLGQMTLDSETQIHKRAYLTLLDHKACKNLLLQKPGFLEHKLEKVAFLLNGSFIDFKNDFEGISRIVGSSITSVGILHNH